jgi:heme/copper-type cytochrome/quinol oxidase subunit 2
MVTLITVGLMLQSLQAGATTQGDSTAGWFTTYGLETVVVLAVLVVIGLAIAACRRTKANSRGNEKKF